MADMLILIYQYSDSKILLNDYDFWQFSINPWYMRVYVKMPKVIIIWQKFAFEATPENNIFSEILDKKPVN